MILTLTSMCNYNVCNTVYMYLGISETIYFVVMIGGVFVYNHKGEVLISRVFRDSVT